MKPLKFSGSAAVFFSLAFLTVYLGCGESRLESRQARLDSFRGALPEEVLLEFDSIENEMDCHRVGALLEQRRNEDPGLDAVVDSIMHAELIDSFSNYEIVRFFWYYFAFSIAKNDVPNP